MSNLLDSLEGPIQWSTRWLEVITKLKDMGLSKLWEMLKDREAWGAAVHGFAKSWMQFIDRTATKLL